MPDRRTRALSFGAIAEDYDRYRPGPPIEAVRWVLGTDRRRVVDLGAGTGGLTRSILALAPRVVALEPDARMRRVLAARAAGAAVLGALGEHLPLSSGGVDAVLASSSWHWMDPDLAGAEVARVLRPGGVFGLLWSGPDRSVPWVADVLGRRRPPGGDDSDHRRRRAMVLSSELPFGTPESTIVRFSRTVDLDDLAGLSGTFSVDIVGGDSVRRARIESVKERARRRPEVGEGPVELPMACRSWRVRRL